MSKARVIHFDIETYRTTDPALVESILQEAIEKRPAQNTLKELKTLWDTTEAQEARAAEALSKTALDVTMAEVLVVCAMRDEEYILRATSNGEGDEFELLSYAAATLGLHADADTIWCGHNIEGFDLPILLNRWRRYRITPPEHFPTYAGRWRGRVYDTMLRIPTKSGFISLNEACARYDISMAKDTMWNGAPMTGARVAEAYEAGEHQLLRDYCAADVAMVCELYSVMTCGGTRGTYGTPDEVAAKVREIEESHLSDGLKAMAIVKVLDNAGRIPR